MAGWREVRKRTLGNHEIHGVSLGGEDGIGLGEEKDDTLEIIGGDSSRERSAWHVFFHIFLI